MLKLVKKLLDKTLVLLIKISFSFKFFIKKLKFLFQKKYHICIKKNNNEKKILLLAIYEFSELRHDIVNLLNTAKDLDLYTIVINTGKLSNYNQYSDIFDLYIERINLGQDFGSYKLGFETIFNDDSLKHTKRVILCNDSVYYLKQNLYDFLKIFVDSDLSVLGATENFEIEHHFGSFFISMSQKVISNKKFKSFWRGYKVSETRPKVISNGEMGLSRTLKSIIQNPFDIKAHFDVTWFQEQIFKNEKNLLRSLKLSRTSSYVGWKRINSAEIALDISQNTIIPFTNKVTDFNGNIVSDNPFYKFFEHQFDINNEFFEKISSTLSDVFIQGSQIHQNNSILVNFGFSLLKLDIVYRGMFNSYDVYQFLKLIDNNEDSSAITKLLYKRPFGGDAHFGLKRFAFYRGLI